MNRHPLASSSLHFVFASLFLASAGCGLQLDGGVEPGTGGAGAAPSAIAVLGSQLPTESTPDYMGRAMVTVKPDTLYVFIGNFDETCASPFPSVCTGAAGDETLSQWQMVVGIPAALQQEGNLSVPGSASGIDTIISVGGSGGPQGASSCGEDGPDALTGEIKVTSIDASSVTLAFMGVTPDLAGPQGPSMDTTATFAASRCP